MEDKEEAIAKELQASEVTNSWRSKKNPEKAEKSQYEIRIVSQKTLTIDILYVIVFLIFYYWTVGSCLVFDGIANVLPRKNGFLTLSYYFPCIWYPILPFIFLE